MKIPDKQYQARPPSVFVRWGGGGGLRHWASVHVRGLWVSDLRASASRLTAHTCLPYIMRLLSNQRPDMETQTLVTTDNERQSRQIDGAACWQICSSVRYFAAVSGYSDWRQTSDHLSLPSVHLYVNRYPSILRGLFLASDVIPAVTWLLV